MLASACNDRLGWGAEAGWMRGRFIIELLKSKSVTVSPSVLVAP